jgi:hypothetical protein
MAEVETFSDLLPEVDGVLVVVITSQAEADLELVRWANGASPRSSRIPMLDGPVLGFDISDEFMAFLGPSATLEGSTLYVGDLDRWAPAAVGVSSFRWHATIPGRIGWLEVDEMSRLCWADFYRADGLASATCVPGSVDELVGFDSTGFLVVDHANRSVSRFDATGQRLRSVPGTDALIGPDGQVLIVDRDRDGGGARFSLADSDLASVTDLDWAPENAAGEYGFVAWNPTAHPREIAFHTWADEDELYQLQRWTIDGTPRGTVNLSGRVWDVTWDSTGRYLLAPGVLNERDSVLQVFDTRSMDLVFVHYDNWIQDAELVSPAPCEDAQHIVAAFTGRLPDGVALMTPQMVVSRDATLESWYFMTARVEGGPFGGELATWAHPGFDGRTVDTTNTPSLAVPANDAAASLGFGMTTLDPITYGVDNWLQLDGATASQRCLQLAGD